VFAPAVQVKVGAMETPVAAFAGAVSVGQVARGGTVVKDQVVQPVAEPAAFLGTILQK
jgi:hypothetical protein